MTESKLGANGSAYAAGVAGRPATHAPRLATWVGMSRRTALAGVAAWALLVVLPGASPALAANESDTCTSPTAQVLDGFAGTTYVKLRVQEADADHTWICFRVQDPALTNIGGKVVVTAPGASADPPTQDENSTTCQAEPGNQVPGMHPQASGEIGDPAEPPYVPYLIDTFVDSGEAWFCLGVGEFQKRVILPVPTAQAPDIQFLPDSPPVPAPTPESPPLGYPSGTCQSGIGGDHDRALNADVGDDLHVWLEAWRPSLVQAHLCVRLQGSLPLAGPVGVGGVLSFDASASPGVTPVLTPGDDMSPCPFNVFSNDQAELQIKRSATESNPASLCVKQGTTEKSLTAGVTGTPTAPAVTWTPDPGTPVGPLP